MKFDVRFQKEKCCDVLIFSIVLIVLVLLSIVPSHNDFVFFLETKNNKI